MSKILITHINPHLDDIAAIWLFKKFHPDWSNAEIEFISAEKGNLGLPEEKDTVYFGVGRGKYDEHKAETVTESAMSLVWKDIEEKKLAPKDKFETKALEEIVKWNTTIDTARIPSWEYEDFNVNEFIRSYENSAEDSKKTVYLGEDILDRILLKIIKKYKGLSEWGKRKEFKCKWGKAVAAESALFDRWLAYKKGFNIVITLNPTSKGLSITAPPKTEINLTPIYDKLVQIDKEADWFLHQSKKMVICGDASSPDSKKTELSLHELIEVVQSIK